ncbi:MAG: UDP-3-O-acyl-N-acetylglucosamine deacetylase [Fusobacteriaceae bacterium]|jgi:UDP-3-O-[3-hydroxymyristoyl] N-acetylglucosamine deacetylase|nr:UDP-3-O-acyl-N-acetylglucosamine deacetylase [Fusobacteriaceae bacterium]
MKRKTVAQEICCEGIGLHKGLPVTMRLIPRESDGILFRRADLEPGKNEIKLSLANTFDLTRGTNIKNEEGAAVYTIEHFLSALAAAEISDLMVELDGNELPIGDGSTRHFLELFRRAGIRELDAEARDLVINTPVWLQKGDKTLVILPYEGYKITYAIRFEHAFLKSQLAEFEITPETYEKEIASARTFGFDYEVAYLKKNNLALGGSLENAVVITETGVLNPEGLRWPDEFVRHKMLDIIGDLKVLNRPIKGHVIAVKAGHELDIAFAKLLENL